MEPLIQGRAGEGQSSDQNKVAKESQKSETLIPAKEILERSNKSASPKSASPSIKRRNMKILNNLSENHLYLDKLGAEKLLKDRPNGAWLIRYSKNEKE